MKKQLNPLTNSKRIGDFGEKIARHYLEKKKYKILAQNFKNKWGEIDIIAKKKDEITFFEIKTLHSPKISQEKTFFPEDKISLKKKNQFRKMAQIYLSERKIPLDFPYQIDVLSVEISFDFKKAKIRHFRNIVEDSY